MEPRRVTMAFSRPTWHFCDAFNGESSPLRVALRGSSLGFRQVGPAEP